LLQDNLDEFDSSREVLAQLIDEYNNATKPDYINWCAQQQASPVGFFNPLIKQTHSLYSLHRLCESFPKEKVSFPEILSLLC
jgi:hypothetical protein